MRFPKSPYLGLIIAPLFLFFIYDRGSLTDSPLKVYEKKAPKSELENSRIKFNEVSKKLGIDFKSQLWFPNKNVRIGTLPMLSIYPSSAVVDIDNDGFFDIALSTPHPNSHPKLFHNDSGKGFTDASDVYGFNEVNLTPGTSRLVFADLDHDKNVDLVVTKYGCHEIYWGHGPNKKFIKDSNAFSGYCSNAVGVQLIDVNNDNLLDIIIVNYWLDKDLTNIIPLAPNLASTRLKQPGGQSYLFLNKGNRKFEKTTLLDVLAPNYSNNAGIADINNDGYLDIFIANDYSYDRLLINHGGKFFSEETKDYMPFAFHGLNGMNADFADFNQDGELDLYVGNISNPPFVSYNNVLWERTGEKTFVDTSRDRGVALCGWSWSAKWADFDNDNQLDLVVSNGRARGVESLETNKKSLWHTRTLSADTPRFLRALDPTIDYLLTTKHHISSYERNCLFRQVNGHFYDVAEVAGLTDTEDGYGLSLIDFNNDGKLDFFIANLNAEVVFYENESQTVDNNWIGFNLVSRNFGRLPLGAKLKLYRKNSPPLFSQYYPTNGFNSQSDWRAHFGLGKNTEIDKLEVLWPNTTTPEIYTNLNINSYQDIVEGHANEKN